MRPDRKAWRTDRRTERPRTDGERQNNTPLPEIFPRGIIKWGELGRWKSKDKKKNLNRAQHFKFFKDAE